ncbi:MAG: GlsB/YeaQ/YmgE family stress response membrane protein [Syntrophobacteraceae bacterium]
MIINMQIESLIGCLAIGLATGFLAERIMKGRGAGLAIDLVTGVAGAFLGSFLPGLLKISFHGLIGTLISATVGAVILLFLVGLTMANFFPRKTWWRKALERN